MNRSKQDWLSEHDNPDYWRIVNAELRNPNAPSVMSEQEQKPPWVLEAMRKSNEAYELSKLKKAERSANDFSVNTSNRKSNAKKTIVVPPSNYRILPDRQILFDKQNGLCPLCKLPLKSALTGVTIDHIFPKSKGGSNDLSNKQLTHSLCNNIKGDSTEYISPARYRDLTIELKDKIREKRKRRLKAVK